MTNMFFPEGMDPIFSYLVPIPKTISRFTFFREFPFFLFWVYSHFLLTGFVWLISKCFLNYPALSVVWNYISFFTVFYRFVGIGRVELERESGVGRRPSSAQLQSRPHARDVVHVRRQSRRRLLRRSRRRLSNVSRLRPSRREWRKSHLNIKQQQHAVVVVVVIDKWKVLSTWNKNMNTWERYEVVLYSYYYELAHLREIFLEHSWKGKIHDGSAIRVYQAGQLARKQSPSKFRLYRYTGGLWELLLLLHRCTKGKSERESRKSYFSRCELEGN